MLLPTPNPASLVATHSYMPPSSVALTELIVNVDLFAATRLVVELMIALREGMSSIVISSDVQRKRDYLEGH